MKIKTKQEKAQAWIRRHKVLRLTMKKALECSRSVGCSPYTVYKGFSKILSRSLKGSP